MKTTATARYYVGSDIHIHRRQSADNSVSCNRLHCLIVNHKRQSPVIVWNGPDANLHILLNHFLSNLRIIWKLFWWHIFRTNCWCLTLLSTAAVLLKCSVVIYAAMDKG